MKSLHKLCLVAAIGGGAFVAAAQPANDNFANRVTIPLVTNDVVFGIVQGGNTRLMTNVIIEFLASGTLSNATSEVGEPLIEGVSSGQTAWWTWTAPSNGIVTISVNGTNFSPLLTVYTGGDLAGLSLVASNNFPACYESAPCGCHWRVRGQTTFHVARGQAYQIAVDSEVETYASWVSSPILPPPPPYPILLISNPPVTIEPPIGLGPVMLNPYPSVGASGVVIGGPVNGSQGVVLQRRISQAINPSTVSPPETDVQSVETPRILSGGWTVVQTTNVPPGGDCQLALLFSPSPTNDDFANSTKLAGMRTHILASNAGATKEPGEPDHLGNPGGSSVWYSWTAPASGRVTLSTNDIPPYLPPSWTGGVVITISPNLRPPICGMEIDQNPPPPFYPVFAAYTGTNLISLVPAGNCQPMNLDAYPHAVEFDAIKGQTYQIVFDGNKGTTRRTPLYLVLTKPAANDSFMNRIKLRGIYALATGFNAGATHEPGEPVPAGSTGKTVWWTWTAPVGGGVTIDLGGSDYSFPVAVFTGSRVANLNLAGEGTGGVTFEAVQGQTYQIAVSDLAGLTGAIKMKLQAPVVELDLLRAWRFSAQIAVLEYRAAAGQKILLQRSTDGTLWQDMSTAVAGRKSVSFLVRPAPGVDGPYYRAIIVDSVAR